MDKFIAIESEATKEAALSAREAWLQVAASRLLPLFEQAGGVLPARVRFACGWPGAAKALGSCFHSSCSETAHREIFISPELADPLEVLHVLLHEMCHAALPDGVGHRKPFKKLATACGLLPPMRATSLSPALTERLNALLKQMGPYPHSRLGKSSVKKQTTRMIKIVCEDCGYVARTTAKWADVGMPTCCCGGEFQVEEPE